MSTSHTAVVRPPWRRRAVAWIVPARDRAQEARLVGDRAAAAGGHRVGDRRVDAAVDEPQRLLERVGDGDPRTDLVVGSRSSMSSQIARDMLRLG